MWIDRKEKKDKFIQFVKGLKRQVLVLRGARQVGKTSFVLNALESLTNYHQLRVNLLYSRSISLNGLDYFGRDFFGKSEQGEDFLKNIAAQLGHIEKPVIIFIDEADQHPFLMESIQTLAEFSEQYKFVITGSNLENIKVKNAATGRKKYFDLYPITFLEFLRASKAQPEINYIDQQLDFNKNKHTEFMHQKLNGYVETYIRLGGMPKILDVFLDPKSSGLLINDVIVDLAQSIEENVKTVLGEKQKLYEYTDVLRKLAMLSLNTLKFTHLQVQYAGRNEAKKLVHKTVGARVAHKIRLFEDQKDLSKYILFDCGLVNYLLTGSDLLKSFIEPDKKAILYETFVGNEIIANLTTRDDLLYWKSQNKAEIEFMLTSPFLTAVDVKSCSGKNKALDSFALFNQQAGCLVKISKKPVAYVKDYKAVLPNYPETKAIKYLTIPHYLTHRLNEILQQC